ncbi:hypothetical protein C2W62_35420 [Candidatus Entotheonella serta]|nr:hypothetical protein C2W62_35420 [Candidatus Entotheonella serta]
MSPHHLWSGKMANAIAQWHEHGFAILSRYLSISDLASAQAELELLFPTPEDFHNGVNEQRNAMFRDDEFAGIVRFPFDSMALCLLAVHPRLVTLAEALLGTEDIRLYAAEAWAKYTGAADYDQWHHRDYLNHTLLVPTEAEAFGQVEMFLYLSDVPEELGPPHFVSKTYTRGTAALPNWLSREQRPAWYAAEVSGAGPAGTVVAYHLGTFHRGTALIDPRGARYTIHVSYRAATTEWAQRCAWADCAHEPMWYRFVERASLRQLLLFGFPPPGHSFWTEETLTGIALRYPQLDLTPFRL